LQGECATYLKDEKLDDLSRMYHLLTRIDDGIKPMLDVLQNHVSHFGLEAIKSVPEGAKMGEVKYITTLLSVYNKFNEIVKSAFETDPAFVSALDRAMRMTVNNNPINKNSTKSPELLAKYSDYLLSKSNREFNFDKLDEVLSHVLIIFKYVDDKYVFQKFYSKMLARRLIHGTSVSDDAESAMIGGLKQACGYDYTSKLQRMFNDMSASNDINEKFKEHLSAKSLDTDKVDFGILVLTAGSWPLSVQPSSFNVPQEIEKCVDHFTAFYSANHSGRKLSWLHHLAKGDLKTLYLPRKYEFQVTNFQMGVLLMFNRAEKLTLDEVCSHTGLKDKELQRTLMSLWKSRILKKEPVSKTFAGTDVFVLNPKFTSKRLRFKPAAGMQKETKEQNKDTYKSINEDRILFLQAAIVRIMKMRKKLTHTNLVKETIEQATARFQPNVPMIKKCVEQLIEKEYLQRVEGETNTYAYVA